VHIDQRMKKINPKSFLTAGVILCLLSGCATVIKKEDIFLEAQKIKAAAIEKPTPIVTVVPQELPPTVNPNLSTTPPTIQPIVLEPLPLPAQVKLSREETLVYRSKFLGIAIGEFTTMNKGKVTVNGRPAYCFEIDVKTLPFFSALFQTKDRYVSYLDAEKFVVLRHEEYIKSGTFLESSTDFDHLNHTALYKNFVTHKEKTVAIPEKIIDVISGGFYLRTIPLAIGDTQEVDLYADEKIYNFVGLIHSKIIVTMPSNTKQDAFLFKPYVFKDGKQITKISAEVYFATDEAKTPLRAILKTPLGNVTVVLIPN
jgi:hypothetical protein